MNLKPSTQHMPGCLTAVGHVGNPLANALQNSLHERENDPSLPDVNHDLLHVLGISS